jgi:BMFP domain-containing protein YqiC
MLPEGWRPLLLGENMQPGDEYGDRYEFPEGSAPKWNAAPGLLQSSSHMRTRRPLPPPPPTFEHDGRVWNSHIPGDPCPVGDSIKVEALYVYGGRYECGVVQEAAEWNWKALSDGSIISYRIPDAKPVNETDEPQDDTAKLRERIAELEIHIQSRDKSEAAYVECTNKHVTKLEQRIAELEDWKAQTMRVESEWDEQKLAKMLGGNLGESCRKIIQKRVPELLARIAKLEQQLATWETEIGAVMPPDFKDWHQNAKSEWPVVARSVIESLRKRESQAWDHLATALTPRPIEEAGEVKDGFVRLYGKLVRRFLFDSKPASDDTHFIDIRLPSPDPRAEYERAVAEAGGAFEAWLKAKGGVA